MDELKKQSFIRWAVIIIAVTIVLLGVISILPELHRQNALKSQVADINRQIQEKRRETADIALKCRRFETDREFVESIARKNRRVFPGEIVFLFEDQK